MYRPRIIPCLICGDKYTDENEMRAHAIDRHGKFISQCSTGLAERIVRENEMKIRRRRESKSTYQYRSTGNKHGNSHYSFVPRFFKQIERMLK